MDWTVAPISSEDSAIAPMLRDGALEMSADCIHCAVREDESLRALHVFAPVDVLIDHRRRRVLRLAASVGNGEACEVSLPAALRCAADETAAHHAACVCALVDSDVAAASRDGGYRGEPMQELVFPTASNRRARVLDLAAAFGELMSAELVRFDYHALFDAERSRAPVFTLERNANFIWGVRPGDGATFEVRGCELNHPQLFPEMLTALGAKYRVASVRFFCSAGSMLARAARVRARPRAQVFVHNLPDASSGIRFDAHAGLACSRH